MLNHCVEPADRGAVGRQGFIMKKLRGHRIVKFDVVEEKPVRGKDGFCIECGLDEPGELLFPIKQEDPSTHFVGYVMHSLLPFKSRIACSSHCTRCTHARSSLTCRPRTAGFKTYP